jgi:hypothetical protein
MTTICPDAGRLRAWLDGKDRPDGADRSPNSLAGRASATHTPIDHDLGDHLAACAACQETLVILEHDADHAARALAARVGSPPTADETERALVRLRGTMNASASTITPAPESALASATAPRADVLPVADQGRAPRSLPTPIALVWRRWRLALGSLAAALALTVTLATPEGQAAAAGLLAQFRSQRLAIVTFDPNQARQPGLFRFEQLGAVRNSQPTRPIEVANVQEAAGRAGFPVLQPDPATLPPGTPRTPKVRFSPASETRLTFDRQKSRAYFDSINRQDLSLPDRLHGASLVVSLPPIVMLEYAGSDTKPAVMIGQAREVQVGVEGNASLDEVRSFLLGLPNVPPDLARQLRSIQDWTSTLPIPVPVDKLTWQETTIAGASGYILNDNTGLGSGVIWQRDGRILGVAGPMKATDLRRVAESLK